MERNDKQSFFHQQFEDENVDYFWNYPNDTRNRDALFECSSLPKIGECCGRIHSTNYLLVEYFWIHGNSLTPIICHLFCLEQQKKTVFLDHFQMVHILSRPINCSFVAERYD